MIGPAAKSRNAKFIMPLVPRDNQFVGCRNGARWPAQGPCGERDWRHCGRGAVGGTVDDVAVGGGEVRLKTHCVLVLGCPRS